MLNIAWNLASNLINHINENLSNYSPSTLIVASIASVLVLQKTYQLYQGWDRNKIYKNLKESAIKQLEKMPYVGPKIKGEIDKQVRELLQGIKKEIDEARSEWKIYDTLPENGLPDEIIKERFRNLQDHYQAGKLSGGVYTDYPEHFSKLLQFVWSKTALTNPMHSDWPLINLMEAEVIAMCQNLLKGEAGSPGIITHGGSTSILEACKAYVLHARKKGIQSPEIIVPDSAHAAFDKAAEILNIKLVKVPVNEKTGQADVRSMEKAINKNTCMLVGSAPSFPMGLIDPIEELGQIAIKHNIPLHVDSCLGGFLTVFAKEAGFDIPPCDFSVPGVSSISIDTHKYGQTPKGTSVLLFNQSVQASPTHVYLDWVGGMYVTPGIDGSRSGADIALTWTVLCYHGKQAYIDNTRDILWLQRYLISEIKELDGLIVPYDPKLSIIPIQSKPEINSLLIADRLKQKGWSVNILQTPNQKACGFHFCLTRVHAEQPNFIDEFTNDLKEALEYAKANPNEKPKGMAKAYGKLEKGVPFFVQEKIGRGYVRILNTTPNVLQCKS